MFQGFSIPSGGGPTTAFGRGPAAPMTGGSGLIQPAGRLADIWRENMGVGKTWGKKGDESPQLHPVWTPQSIGLNLLHALSSGDWSKMSDSWFGPKGNEQMLAMLRGQAMDDAGAGQNRAAMAARVYGAGDPSRAGYAALESSMRGQSDTARLMGGVQARQAEALQAFYRQVLMQMLQGAYGQVQTEIGAASQKKETDWGGLGQGAGAVIGAFAGGGAV